MREALLRLACEGLVEIAPGRWTRVSATHDDDARLIFPPHAALHATAAAAAASHVTQGDVAKLLAINAELKAAIGRGNSETARAADERFHDRIADLAANPHLTRALLPLRSLARRYELTHFSHAAPARASYGQHERIINALKVGDAAAAESLTKENMLS